MMSESAKTVAQAAERIYTERLQETLERDHFGEFVCIEPTTGDYFLGCTLDEAVNAALDAHPGKLTRTLRIGHLAALQLGVFTQ